MPVRRLSDEIRLQQTFGDAAASDYDGWEAGLADLSRDRTLANMKQGRGASYRDGVTRDRVVTSLTELRARLDQLRMDADADLAALLQQELRGALDRYEALKARDGALDFLDLLLVARNLVRDNAACARGFSSAARASSSTSSRTPTRCRQRSSCCWPPTIPPKPTGAARGRSLAGSFWLAIRSSRSIASAAPMSPSIAMSAAGSKSGARRRCS